MSHDPKFEHGQWAQHAGTHHVIIHWRQGVGSSRESWQTYDKAVERCAELMRNGSLDVKLYRIETYKLRIPTLEIPKGMAREGEI